MADRDTRMSASLREARLFRDRLVWRALAGQTIMVLVLAAMTYFKLPLRWMLIAGLFLGVATVCGLIFECALRFDAGRSYLEQWSEDAENWLNFR